MEGYLVTDLEKDVISYVEDQGNKDDQNSYVKDVLNNGCVSGIVSGLIYTSDTHAFFEEHYNDIMALVERLEDDSGLMVQPEGDIKNWYAWLAFEETLRDLYGEELGY